MSDKVNIEIQLNPEMKAFLDEMVKKYELPDPDKALRCLINYARSENDKQDDIFHTVRCHDC